MVPLVLIVVDEYTEVASQHLVNSCRLSIGLRVVRCLHFTLDAEFFAQ